MKHYYIKDDLSGDHYAVSHDTLTNKQILLQVQEEGVQARISITAEQAEHLIMILRENISKTQ